MNSRSLCFPRASFSRSRKHLLRSYLLLAFACFQLDASAAPPDLTAGESPTTTNHINLGPTGLQGWLYHNKTDTSESRQILITSVDASSPADGVLAVEDVILGADGTGANPVNFSSDARRSLAQAIQDAEANSPATLKLLRWRAGVTTTETITLQTLGAYSATAPYNCPKSALILENGLAHRTANEDAGNMGLGALALLAADDPTNPANAARQTLAQAEAHALIATQEKIDFWKSGQIDTGSKITWTLGHKLIVLAEYYLKTSDPLVLPTIEAMAVQLANGQSHLGTMGHQLTNPDAQGILNGTYNVGYGAVNSAGMPTFLGLLLAKECGLTNPEIDPAIERASRFYSAYTGYSAHPYGEHGPNPKSHEANGKSGLASLCFMLLDDRAEDTTFFSKMATAAASEREDGHNGPYFNQLWAPLGAAAGGEEAVTSHFSQISWMLDLNREWDGGFYWNRLEGSGGGERWYDFDMSTVALLAYALPLRELHITGRAHDTARYLSSQEVADAIAADDYDASARTTTELVTDLGVWSPKVQALASKEIGLRTAEHATLVPQLIAIANDTQAGESRVGACFALGEIGDGSAAADLAALLDDAEGEVRFASAEALRYLPQAAKLAQVDTILAAAASTGKPFFPIDDEDPLQFAHHRLSMLLFYGGLAYGPKGVISGDQLDGIDRNLLYPAIRAVASNPNGQARSTLSTTYPYLTQADVESLADVLIDSVQYRAPADKMFAGSVRNKGLDALQAFNYAEGVPLSRILVEESGVQGIERTRALNTLELYAGSSTLVEPDPAILDFCENLVFLSPGVAADAQLVINAILADTTPATPTPFKSIQSVTADQTSLTLPSKWTQLHVTSTDLANGDSVYTWRKIHGAGSVTFSDNGTSTAKDTTVVFDDVPGLYLFEITMSDSRGLTEVSGTVAVTVYDTGGGLPPNSAPTATPQSVIVTQATTTPINLTGTDPEGYALTYAIATPPANGKLRGTPPYLTYTSNFNFTGADSFSFEVMDSEGQVSSAIISITVDPTSGLETAIYEPFDYSIGLLNGQSGTSEVGLDGTWTAHPSTAIVSADSLNYGSLFTAGGKFEPNSTNNRFGGTRSISSSALQATGLLNDGSTLWFSAMVGYGPTANGTNARLALALANSGFNTGYGDYWIQDEGQQLGQGVGFVMGAHSAGSGIVMATLFQDLSQGDGTAGNISGSWEGNGAAYAPGEHGLVVGRITWAASPADPDIIEIFHPDTDMELPASASSILEVTVDQSTFDTLSFTRGDLPLLDEIRFGGTYHSVLLGTVPMSADTTPPTPDPVGFDSAPFTLNGTSVTMTAATAYDVGGVEYYFTCTSGGGNDSDWQSSPTYVDSGLTPGVPYSYTVTARDLSPAQNTTNPSAAASVTTPSQVLVPEVVGMSQSAADSIFNSYSLAVGTVTTQSDPFIPAGEVLSQSPLGETIAAVGTSIDLLVSSGPDTNPPVISPTDIVDDQGGASVTEGDLVTYTISFSQDMDHTTVDATDFSNTGNSTITIGTITEISSGVFTIQVTPTDGGTLQLQIPAGAALANAGGIPLDTSTAIIDDTSLIVESNAVATAVIYEPFDYPAGAIVGKSGSSQIGLDGTWIASSTTQVISPSLSYGSLPTSGGSIGNLSGSQNRFGGARSISASALAANGLLDDGNSLWFSAVVGYGTSANKTNAKLALALSNNQFNGGNNDFWIVDEGPQVGSGIGLYLGNVNGYSGSVLATQFRDLASGDGIAGHVYGTWETAGTVYDQNEHGLIVGRIDWGAGSDTITLYQPDTSLNLGTAISTLTVDVDQSTFDTLTFARGDVVAMDEVRFGGSFESVLGATTIPDTIPPTLASSDIVDDLSGANVIEGNLVTHTVTFSEDMDETTVDDADFSNAGSCSITIGTITETLPGVFTVEVTPTNPGTLQLQVSAGAIIHDMAGNPLNTLFAITDDTTITVDAANSAPTWNSDPIVETNAAEDGSYSSTLADDVTDPDAGDTLTFTKVSGPAWLNVANNGTLSGTPSNSDVGANSFTISVSDNVAPAVNAIINIMVINTNDAPVFAFDPIAGSDATEDLAYSGSVAGSASDVDAVDSLTYTKASGPAWLVVATNGDFSGLPSNADVGANVFTISVSDGNGGFDSATLNITVINTNDAPVFAANPIAGSDATEDAAYVSTIAGSASDEDAGDSLTYAKVSGPAWLSVGTDGSLSGTPTNDEVDANAFTVSVTDGNIATAVEATLNITVINTNDAPVFAADPISGSDATEDAAYVGTIAGSVSDEDAGDSLTYAKVSGPAWLSIGIDGSLSGTPTNDEVGANAFTVSVTDGNIATAVEATLNITVINTNDAPLVDAGSDQFITMTAGAGGAWTPAEMTTAVWFDAADVSTITDTNGAVSEWADKSGNTNHLTQLSETEKPTTNLQTIGGLNALNFDDDFMRTTTQNSNVRAIFFISDNLNGSTTNASVAPVIGEVTANQSYTFVRTNTTDYSISIDGANNLTGAASVSGNTPTGGTNINLGVSGAAEEAPLLWYAEYDSNVVMDYLGLLTSNMTFQLKGTIGEFIALESVPSLEDRQKIEGYLAHKWGVEADLPVGHPYKTAAPGGGASFSAMATLDATASDPDGDSFTTDWTVTSGPAGVDFGNASTEDTTATFTAEGTYVLRLAATDPSSATGFDEVTITVDATAPTLAASNFVDDQTGANVTENDLVTYTVSFSEDMDATSVDATDFSNAGSSSVTIGAVTETSPGVFTVEATPTTSGSLQLQVSAAAVLTDLAGNALDTTSAIIDDTVITVDAPPVTVPNVIGLAQATAESNIVAANLIVGSVTLQSSETVPEGDVMSQGLTAGSSVPQGSAVDLVVSLGANASPKLVRTTVSSVSSASWTTVDLGQTYASAVIIATPIYPNTSTPPVVTRIRNVSGSNFDLKLDRADGLTGTVTIDVSVIAVDEGVYTQAVDGVTMEAVKFTSTVTARKNNWFAESRSFQNSYTNPVVVGQVMSTNDAKWSAFWSMGNAQTNPVNATNLNVGKHVGEDPNSTRANETIGYIVIESGSGSINGVAYEAAVGADIVRGIGDSSTPYTYSLSGGLASASAAALSVAGMDGGDGGWAVLSGANPITTTALRMHLDEDVLGDSERAHTDEQFSYIVFE